MGKIDTDKPIVITLDELKQAYARHNNWDVLNRAIGKGDYDLTGTQRFEFDQFLVRLSDVADPEGRAATFAPVLLTALDMAPAPPLLLDRLDSAEHTVLFGPGGIGKGSLACSWIVQLTRRGHNVLVLDYENHGSEWARRIEGLGGLSARESVAWVAPLAAGAGPIWQHADRIAELMVAQENPYIVIDSAMMACAGKDPSDPETPGLYYGALQQIGVPNLTLAHVTKVGDPRMPFGSVQWHNLARVTWSMMPKGEDVLLTCQKDNNHMKPSAAVITMTWFEGMLREVSETRAIVKLLDRIIEVLADGPATAPAIAATLNDGLPKDEHTSLDTVRNALNRELRRGTSSRVTIVDGQWLIRPAEAE
jgi:AAA domain